MKIAVIAHGLSNGGAERVASFVANYYAKIGHEVLFVAVYSPEKVYPLSSEVKYEYTNGNQANKITKGYTRVYNTCKTVKTFQPDVIVSFIINETAVYSLFTKTPIIYSLRQNPMTVCSTFAKKIRCLFAYNKAEKVIFQTIGAKNYFPIKIRNKGVVIPNPLTRNLPCWDAENSNKTIITACRLNKQKNLPMLISAFAIFRETHPDYILRIYGEGELLEELNAYAVSCGVKESVSFPGYAKNSHEIMACSGIFALTSDYEGLSNSMLEALAIGIPTVCTDCPPGGAAMYIPDGENGMLVPVGDAQALADKLCQMAENPALCARMSANAQKIREELEVDKVLKQWEEVLCI